MNYRKNNHVVTDKKIKLKLDRNSGITIADQINKEEKPKKKRIHGTRIIDFTGYGREVVY